MRLYLESDILVGSADNVTNCCSDLTIYVYETCAAELKCMPSIVVPVLSYPYAAVVYIAPIHHVVVHGPQLG